MVILLGSVSVCVCVELKGSICLCTTNHVSEECRWWRRKQNGVTEGVVCCGRRHGAGRTRAVANPHPTRAQHPTKAVLTLRLFFCTYGSPFSPIWKPPMSPFGVLHVECIYCTGALRSRGGSATSAAAGLQLRWVVAETPTQQQSVRKGSRQPLS